MMMMMMHGMVVLIKTSFCSGWPLDVAKAAETRTLSAELTPPQLKRGSNNGDNAKARDIDRRTGTRGGGGGSQGSTRRFWLLECDRHVEEDGGLEEEGDGHGLARRRVGV